MTPRVSPAVCIHAEMVELIADTTGSLGDAFEERLRSACDEDRCRIPNERQVG